MSGPPYRPVVDGSLIVRTVPGGGGASSGLVAARCDADVPDVEALRADELDADVEWGALDPVDTDS